jgi:hypothetical protein
MEEKKVAEGYRRALALMKTCNSTDGFLATPTRVDNYRRIWARDGCIIGLAALMTDDEDLISGCRRTLNILAENQGPHGEIPSNVDAQAGRISYGGTTGRVDSDLWFIIASSQYWKRTGDDAFLDGILQNIERVRFLLGAWEFNNRGLLYVPLTGDWADEYLHHGYVLYDQLLYLQAQRELCDIHRYIHGSADHELTERVKRFKAIIRDNYWLTGQEELPEYVYHEVLYRKATKASDRCAGKYWAPFFSPTGYGYRFDAMANIFASLLGVSDERLRAKVDAYVRDEVNEGTCEILPAFHPVITPRDEDWEDLQMTFSYSFKNEPYEYHNGGLWPLVTGFYAADLALRGEQDLADQYLTRLDAANKSTYEGDAWSFPEYLDGKSKAAGGTKHMGWSAAAAVIAHEAVNGKEIFLGRLS